MTTFPGSSRLNKGGIVLIDPETSAVQLELNIEELVLHGFSPVDRYRIGEVVERELAHMIAEQDLPSSLTDGGKIDYLDCGAFVAVQGSRPEAIGLQVAQVIYR